jgi:hypothetical protein
MVMKRWYGLLLPVFLSASFLGGYAAPQDRQYVDYFLRLQAADLFREKSFLLNWSCAYVNQNRLLGVDLCFSCYRAVSIRQARKLLVEVAERIVDKINKDPSLRERNLLPEPFTLNQVYLKIETDNVFSAQVDMETIQSMCLDRGNISYRSYPASTLFYGRDTKFEETLEQARMLLGEEVPFSGMPVLHKEELTPPPPSPEIVSVPEKQQGNPPTRSMEPVEKAFMTPIQEVKLVTLDKENMLEEQEEAHSTKQDLWQENLLGALFEAVAEEFHDLRVHAKDQQCRITRVMMPVTTFPEANKEYYPQSLTVEDVSMTQETPQRTERQSWNVVELPADNMLPAAPRQTDEDRSLSEAASVPYKSIAVFSSCLPETTEDSMASQPVSCGDELKDFSRHGGENFIRDMAAELPSSLTTDEKKEEVVASDDEMEATVSEPWYRRIKKWFQGEPRATETVHEQAEISGAFPKTPELSSVLPLTMDEEDGLTKENDLDDNTEENGQIVNEGLSGDQDSQLVYAEPVNSDSEPFFKRIFRWIHGSSEGVSSKSDVDRSVLQEEPLADVYEPSPVSPFPPPETPAAREQNSLADSKTRVVPLPELIDETQEDSSSSSPDGISKPSQSDGVMAKVKSWLFITPRDQQETVETQKSLQEDSQDSAGKDLEESMPLVSGGRPSEENVSWLERFSDWIRGDDGEEASAEVLGAYEPDTDKNDESSLVVSTTQSSDNQGTVVIARLGDVNRPDESLEDLEEDMWDDDDDDEATRPGIVTRTFSAIHSLWQSVLGEAASTEGQKKLDDSMASRGVEESVSSSKQPS